jgi:hypothetical protein
MRRTIPHGQHTITEADENRIKSYSYNLVSNQTIFVFLMSLKKLPVLLFISLLVTAPLWGAALPVTDFGAKGDGKTLNTRAIQQAIDQCTKTGGTVLVPAGTFLTGTLYLKSNVELRLEKGAVLLGSSQPSDYPDNYSTYPSLHTYDRNNNFKPQPIRALLFAENAENISLTGEGTVDGNGKSESFQRGNDAGGRPQMVYFLNCRGVTVKDVTLTNPPVHVQFYAGCDGVVIRGIKVYGHSNWNNDALDIDSRNVTVSDCLFDTDDDALCFKTDGERPCENVTVTNCVLASNCNAIKMGTSGLAGYKNITITNCVIRKASEENFRHWRPLNPTITADTTALAGIALEMVDGGVMDQITLSNITMTGVQTPIFIKLGNRGLHLPNRPVPKPGILRNILISNIVATSESLLCNSVTGMPGSYVENVVIKDVILNSPGGGTQEQAERTVPENEKDYPENRMFGPTLPAFGFYVRHVKGISLQNIQVHLRRPDARPVLVLDDVQTASVLNLASDAPLPGSPFIRAVQSRNVLVQGFNGGHAAGPADRTAPRRNSGWKTLPWI